MFWVWYFSRIESKNQNEQLAYPYCELIDSNDMIAYMNFMADPLNAAFVLFGIFFLLLFMGSPIAVAIVSSSLLVGIAYLPPETALFISTQKMQSSFTVPSHHIDY